MAYFIQRQSRINPDITVYYCGDSRWSDDSNAKKTFSRKMDATALMVNSDGKNGGWTGSVIQSTT